MTTKARTLRLAIDQAKELEAIAAVDEVSVNEEIRRDDAHRGSPSGCGFPEAPPGQHRPQ